jgi:hypothetical protein
MITQAELKKLLHYDPDTGVFIRRVKTSIRNDVGSVAGCINGCGYQVINIDYIKHAAHRLAWLYVYGKMPTHTIDHINGIRSDNRMENLRDVPHQTNRKNSFRNKSNTSGINGVHFVKARQHLDSPWCATIRATGKSINLGYFKSKQEAGEARKAADNKYGFHPTHGRSVDG